MHQIQTEDEDRTSRALSLSFRPGSNAKKNKQKQKRIKQHEPKKKRKEKKKAPTKKADPDLVANCAAGPMALSPSAATGQEEPQQQQKKREESLDSTIKTSINSTPFRRWPRSTNRRKFNKYFIMNDIILGNGTRDDFFNN